MNRPIEFRVWDKELKEMDFFIKVEGGETLYMTSLLFDDVTKKRFEAMQFTGLLDCNYNKIFEGDLIELVDPMDILKLKQNVFEIQFDHGTFCFYEEKKDGRDFYPLCDFECKIVGNIFEGVKNGS